MFVSSSVEETVQASTKEATPNWAGELNVQHLAQEDCLLCAEM